MFAMATMSAIPVHIVRTDLRPLIQAAAQSVVQFAVQVPYSVTTASDGQWSTANGIATWRYAVRVPTAISLSFHANESTLPANAVLVVRGTKTTASYQGRDLRRGELWNRIQAGEALEFELSVPATAPQWWPPVAQ
jgi:hypothetical protein